MTAKTELDRFRETIELLNNWPCLGCGLPEVACVCLASPARFVVRIRANTFRLFESHGWDFVHVADHYDVGDVLTLEECTLRIGGGAQPTGRTIQRRISSVATRGAGGFTYRLAEIPQVSHK